MFLIKLRIFLFKFLEYFLNPFSYRICKKCKSKIKDKFILICKSCIETASEQKNLKTYKSLNSNIEIYFQYQYRDKLFKKLILDLKNKSPELAIFFGISLKNLVLKKIDSKKSSDIYLSLVPISTEKYQLRKYNQAKLISETLAKELSKEKNLKVRFIANLFLRTKNTEALLKLNSEEREKELERAFSFNTQHIKVLEKIKSNSRNIVIIIDDISTTGLTLIKLSEELNKNGLNYQQILAFTCTGRNFD